MPSPYLPPELTWDEPDDDAAEPDPELFTLTRGVFWWTAGSQDDDD